MVAQNNPRSGPSLDSSGSARAHTKNKLPMLSLACARQRANLKTAGYQVQTLRLTTQSLGEFIAGMANEQALAFLARLDQLSVKEDFLPADALTAIESVRHTGRKPADRIFPREEKKGLTERKQERFDTRSWIVRMSGGERRSRGMRGTATGTRSVRAGSE